MSNYSQTTSFTPKDSLVTGDTNKLVRGSELDTEFAAIATSIATKHQSGDTLRAADGTAAAPGVAFASDTDTGLFHLGANQPAIAAAGGRVVYWDGAATGQMYLTSDGTGALPAYSFNSDPDTGVYRVSANKLSITCGGNGGWEFSATDMASAFPIRTVDGSAATPIYSFISDPDTGVYRLAANNVGFAAGGVLTFQYDQNAIYNIAGTSAHPSYTFTVDPDTGIYSSGGNQIGFATGGGARVFIDATALYSRQPVYAYDGDATSPGYAYENDPDTGYYRIGSNQLGFTEGAVGFRVGFRNIPQSIQAANYTAILADSGKHIYHASGAGAGDTYTIPANASVAYDIGTVLTFINSDSNAVSIAITTDTMTLAGTVSTGTRTLAQNGVATAIKVTSTAWIISGTGLT